jgi:hypothetical protein
MPNPPQKPKGAKNSKNVTARHKRLTDPALTERVREEIDEQRRVFAMRLAERQHADKNQAQTSGDVDTEGQSENDSQQQEGGTKRGGKLSVSTGVTRNWDDGEEVSFLTLSSNDMTFGMGTIASVHNGTESDVDFQDVVGTYTLVFDGCGRMGVIACKYEGSDRNDSSQ